MELNWFESLIFGLVSGLTEILPVSAPAHEALICRVFGMPDHPLLRLLIHASPSPAPSPVTEMDGSMTCWTICSAKSKR